MYILGFLFENEIEEYLNKSGGTIGIITNLIFGGYLLVISIKLQLVKWSAVYDIDLSFQYTHTHMCTDTCIHITHTCT